MRYTENSLSPKGSKIYTLAQSVTPPQRTKTTKRGILVNGEGTEVSNSKALESRAKKKMLTQKIALSLIAIAEKKGDTVMAKTFWNTYYCQNKIYQSNSRIHGNYCKTKICTVCNGIKKAELINKYQPIIEKWSNAQLVTLTAKSVSAKSLKKRIQQMLEGLRIILNRYKTKHQRGQSIKLQGIRSLECNFNPVRRTYNPHFHLIVANKETADILIKEWQTLLTSKFTYKKAQHCRAIKNTEKDMMEAIKYGSKIFTDPTMEKGEKATPYVYTSALYNILNAMAGHRLYERFGFNLPKELSAKKRTVKTISHYEELQYDSKLYDWVNAENDSLLTGYKPTLELLGILEYNINEQLN